VFALGWYYLAYHGIWKSAIPLLARLHVERITVVGHMIYGALLARYLVYLQRWEQPAAAPEAGAAVSETPVPAATLAPASEESKPDGLPG
jgi:hypothetical protein